MRRPHTASLPQFPWDTLAGVKRRAQEHPDGIVDLSVGTPVDPVPELGQMALAAATDRPGYPTTIGTPALREAMVGYLTRRCGVTGLDESGVLPVIGTKELVANLPSQLGLGDGDVLVIPEVAYPTYAVGGALAEARVVLADDPDAVADQVDPDAVTMVWLNTPSNPTGAVLAVDRLRAWVEWARAHDAILVADECYLEFGWEADPVSVLHPDVNGGSLTGVLAAHSLSKRSNLAGYRCGFVAGDPALIAELTEVRKHSGFLMPAPLQDAMTALLGDHSHVQLQRERYSARRGLLRPALESVSFRIDHSEAGLYLWATRGESGRESIEFLAGYGILAAPGDFYGTASDDHVRIALTATDERIRAGVDRLIAG